MVGVVGIGQDITARIAQEREYAWLIDTANAPIFGIDKNSNVNVWNQCAAKMTGHTTEEAMGVNLVSRFITEDYQRSVQEVLDNALNGQETANFEFPLITKTGARIDVRADPLSPPPLPPRLVLSPPAGPLRNWH